MLDKHWSKLVSSLITALLILAAAIIVFAQNAPTKASDSTTTPASYVTSKACKVCHAAVYDKWSSSVHGKMLSADSLPEQIRGCEACHGPGSRHIGSGAQIKPIVPTASKPDQVIETCGKCHFKNDSSQAPKDWQNLSSANWTNSMHARKGISCLSCHTGHPNGNDYQLIKPAEELCMSCHSSVLEESSGKKAAYTHTPVAQGKCLTCHDPHGTKGPHMTVDNISSACVTCHNISDPKIQAAHDNYPIANADCVSCHDPHSHNAKSQLIYGNQHMPFKSGKCDMCHTAPEAGRPVALTKSADQLCFSCHPASTLMPAGQIAHPPVKAGMCTMCHNPHASNSKSLLKESLANTCFTCHTKVQQSTLKKYKHKILADTMNCMLCHTPHSSTHAGLLVKSQTELCGQCHVHKFSHPMGKKPDGTEVMDPTTKAPMTCTSCHEVHGSDFAMLTRGDKNRDLCLRCHNTGH